MRKCHLVRRGRVGDHLALSGPISHLFWRTQVAPFLLEGCPESEGTGVGARPWSPQVPMEPCSTGLEPEAFFLEPGPGQGRSDGHQEMCQRH